jgi:hypothetical protein
MPIPFLGENEKQAGVIVHLYLCLNVRLTPTQGSNLGKPTNGKASLVLGKLNITHGFPTTNPVSKGIKHCKVLGIDMGRLFTIASDLGADDVGPCFASCSP